MQHVPQYTDLVYTLENPKMELLLQKQPVWISLP